MAFQNVAFTQTIELPPSATLDTNLPPWLQQSANDEPGSVTFAGRPTVAGTFPVRLRVLEVNNRLFTPTITVLETAALSPQLIESPVDRETRVGEMAEFHATFAAVPAPNITWYHESSSDPVGIGPFLSLENVQADQAGHYHAVATNHSGRTESSSAVLRVAQSAAIPGDPGLEQLNAIDPSTVTTRQLITQSRSAHAASLQSLTAQAATLQDASLASTFRQTAAISVKVARMIQRPPGVSKAKRKMLKRLKRLTTKLQHSAATSSDPILAAAAQEILRDLRRVTDNLLRNRRDPLQGIQSGESATSALFATTESVRDDPALAIARLEIPPSQQAAGQVTLTVVVEGTSSVRVEVLGPNGTVAIPIQTIPRIFPTQSALRSAVITLNSPAPGTWQARVLSSPATPVPQITLFALRALTPR